MASNKLVVVTKTTDAEGNRLEVRDEGVKGVTVENITKKTEEAYMKVAELDKSKIKGEGTGKFR